MQTLFITVNCKQIQFKKEITFKDTILLWVKEKAAPLPFGKKNNI